MTSFRSLLVHVVFYALAKPCPCSSTPLVTSTLQSGHALIMLAISSGADTPPSPSHRFTLYLRESFNLNIGAKARIGNHTCSAYLAIVLSWSSRIIDFHHRHSGKPLSNVYYSSTPIESAPTVRRPGPFQCAPSGGVQAVPIP